MSKSLARATNILFVWFIFVYASYFYQFTVIEESHRKGHAEQQIHKTNTKFPNFTCLSAHTLLLQSVDCSEGSFNVLSVCTRRPGIVDIEDIV